MHILGQESEKSWKRESMVSDRTRGLEFYANRLNISPELLAGKKVLDLGSGKEAAFARDVATTSGLEETEVISLSPHFSLERGHTAASDLPKTHLVAGIAQQLPFKDESFDYVLGVWSIPFHLRGNQQGASEKEVRKALLESIRVLRVGGELRLFPFINEDIESLKAVLPDGRVEYAIERENVLVLKKTA